MSTIVSLVIHYGGRFINIGGQFQYDKGKSQIVDSRFDVDHLSLPNLMDYVKELRVVNVFQIYFWSMMQQRFMVVSDDSCLYELFKRLNCGDTLDIYIEHVEENVSEVDRTMGMGDIPKFVGRVNENDDDIVLSDDDEEELIAARKNVNTFYGDAEMSLAIEDNGDQFPSSPQLYFEDDEEIDNLEGVENSEENDDKEYDSDDMGSYHSENDESPDIENLSRNKHRIIYDESSTIPIFLVGMVFENVKQFRFAVAKYAITKGLAIRYVKNDPHRVRARCVSTCPWVLFASTERNDNSFQIKTYINKHACYRVSRNKMANTHTLSQLLRNRIIIQPSLKIKDIQSIMKNDYKCNVSLTIARRVRVTVLKELMGEFYSQFGELHDYINEVLKSNPGSTCVVKSNKDNLEGENRFNRLYICFDACKKGWIVGCRPILGLDGSFLKGFIEGQVLCAIGRDGNNQMFPLAWAIVTVENTFNWKWFLRCLKHDLPLGTGHGYTIISDRQKGLARAINDELPEVYHRMCARHIYANWAKKWRGLERKKVFWACAKSTHTSALNKNMEALQKLGDKIVDDMTHYPLHQWSKAFFSTESKCDVVDNNMSETFNGWIMAARWKPIVSMLDDIRKLVMNRIASRREFVNTWINDISPRAMMKLEKNKEFAFNWIVDFNGDDGYEVTNVYDPKIRHVVKLVGQSCTCREWDLSGIPCQHSICALYYARKEPEIYVSHWYRKETYLKAYEFSMQPLRGRAVWDHMDAESITAPPVRKMPGRPRRNRRKEVTESKNPGKLSRQGRKMTCSLCQQQGHNKRSCPTKTSSNSQQFASIKRTDKRPASNLESSSFQTGKSCNKKQKTANQTAAYVGMQWKGLAKPKKI